MEGKVLTSGADTELGVGKVVGRYVVKFTRLIEK
jgi:hypothetical protein